MALLLSGCTSDGGGHPAPASVGFKHCFLIRTDGPIADGTPQMKGGGRYPPLDCADSDIQTAEYNLTGRKDSVYTIEGITGTSPATNGTTYAGILVACRALGLGFIEHSGTPPAGWVWNPAFAVGLLDPSQCGPYLVYNQGWWIEFTGSVVVPVGIPVSNPTPLPAPVALSALTMEEPDVITIARPPAIAALYGAPGWDEFAVLASGEMVHSYIDSGGNVRSNDHLPGRWGALIDPVAEDNTMRYPCWWLEPGGACLRVYAWALDRSSGASALWQAYWRNAPPYWNISELAG